MLGVSMDSQKLSHWIQIATGLAVLAGLGLVVWELQQAKVLTRLQLTSDTYTLSVGYNSSFLGEDPIAVHTRACLDPEGLTLEDANLLEFYFNSLEQRVARLASLEDELAAPVTFGDINATDIEIQMYQVLLELFFTEAGQRWYEDMRVRWPEDMREIGDAAMKTRQKDPSCREVLDRRLERYKR